jgi:hypothetical protein
MRNAIKLWALPLAFVAVSPAMAAENLRCMDSGYEQQANQAQAKFVALYDFDKWSKGEAEGATEMMDAVSKRADACADQHGWSPAAFESAVNARLGHLLYLGIERMALLSPTQFTALTKAVDEADRPRLYRMFGISKALVDYETLDADDLPPEADQLYLLGIVQGAGINADSDLGRIAGALIAARLTRHFAVERFAAN